MLNFKNQSFLKKCICCFLLVSTADILFYGHPVGWTAGLYVGLLLLLVFAFNRQILQSRLSKIIAFATLTLGINIIEEPDVLTMLMSWLGLMSLLILQKRHDLPFALFWLNDIGRFVRRSSWQWLRDYKDVKNLGKKPVHRLVNPRYAVLPIALTLLFGALFSQANPIIAKSLSGLEFGFLNPFESFFSLVLLVLGWVDGVEFVKAAISGYPNFAPRH